MLCHDPRISNDRSSKVETQNAALMITERIRQYAPMKEIDWEKVAEQADYGDEIVDIATMKPHYPDFDAFMLRRKRPL